MNRPIPEEIVARLSELGELLAGWCEAGRDQSLAEHEAAVLARMRQILPRLLEGVVGAATSGLDARLRRARQACPGCGRKERPWEQRRDRQVMTQCGPITLARPWYHCRRCRRGWSVVETVLGVGARAQLSAGVQQWGLELVASVPYQEAAAAEVEQTQEAAEPVDPAPGLLVVETDGAMIRYQDGWHEVKIGLVAGWVDDRLQHPSYIAARASAEPFGSRLLAEAARRGGLEVVRWEGGVTSRGLAILREALILGDGAAWIWKLADDHWTQRLEVVDFYHASEHLATVAQALFTDAAARAWTATRCHELLTAGPAPVLAALRQASASSPPARAILRRERGYFRQHADRMAYPTLRLDGLPIGSGAIESAAAHVVQLRLKRPGMRWSDTGARAVLTLRARDRSGRPLVA
jgi:hypothetical protein